jgi:hypothetical protein
LVDPEELPAAEDEPLDVDVASDAADECVDGDPDRANAAPAPAKPSRAVRPTVAAARGILRLVRLVTPSIGWSYGCSVISYSFSCFPMVSARMRPVSTFTHL